MRISNQRLRTLTTGILHSSEDEAKRDMESITGVQVDSQSAGVVHEALFPWLKSKLNDERFFAPVLDPYHTGETELPEMTMEESTEFLGRATRLIFSQLTKPIKKESEVYV